MQTIWQNRVKAAVQHRITANTLAAFNTNVDVVVHLEQANLAPLLANERIDLQKVKQLLDTDIPAVNNENEFLAVLMQALQEGKSVHIVLRDLAMLDWLEEVFAERQESMGGQAGIIANQMAGLGAHSMVYTSLLSPKQASMFFPEVDVPVVRDGLSIVSVQDAARPGDQIKENWIFEYAKGERFELGGHVIVTPRANRVILATRPEGVVMAFDPDMEEYLPELGKAVDVAFLAGYHYAPAAEGELAAYLDTAMGSVHKLKEQNPDLRLHYEYVPMTADEAERTVLKAVGREIHSFGINENEIKRVLRLYGYEQERAAIDSNECAYTLYDGTLRIMDELGFERIQLHNLGYYVVLVKDPQRVDLEHVREACLYASAVNGIKAKYGGYVLHEQLWEAGEIALSAIGFRQLEIFAEEMRRRGVDVPSSFLEEGILEFDSHAVLIIPAHVIPEPVSTVGMGDTISSSAYAYEHSRR
ncbi:MAG: ADP-dependent glucokinase/phosphofructokinase [Limnochordia bacterium]